MQRALAASDNRAAQPAFLQLQAAQQSGEAAADNDGIKFHPGAPFPDRTIPDKPSA